MKRGRPKKKVYEVPDIIKFPIYFIIDGKKIAVGHILLPAIIETKKRTVKLK